MNSLANRVAEYQFTAPLSEETKAKLQKVYGRERAATIWAETCAIAGCDSSNQHDVRELVTIGIELSKAPGLAGVYGCSLTVRARSFTALASRAAITAGIPIIR